MNFTENLRNLRKEAGFSAKELAKKLNFSQNIVYEWEHGRCYPNIPTLITLSELFGVSVGYLVGSEDEEGSPVVVKHITEDLTPTERELLDAFRDLGPFEQEAISIQIKALAKSKVSFQKNEV